MKNDTKDPAGVGVFEKVGVSCLVDDHARRFLGRNRKNTQEKE
jgi:hypothetical protein